MLCGVAAAAGGGTLGMLRTWAALTLLALPTTMLLSTVVFRGFYWRPTYETWRRKTNPKYPPCGVVRQEVLTTLACGALSTACPALALHLSASGHLRGYCGAPHGLAYEVASFAAMMVACDSFEWAYHWAGHRLPALWARHRHHHVFYNPSPFAVIADDYVDQVVRAAPMLVLPAVAAVNIDVLFLSFAVLFYAYGAYLHWGHETDWPDAHHPWINTAYQHYLHHAKSGSRTPYHTGFFIKLWDQLAGGDKTAEDKARGACGCVKCARARGERSRAKWDALPKPDYSPLLSARFWLTGAKAANAA